MSINHSLEKIKIVFFDIDETLFVKEKDYLPESTYLALKTLREKGVLVGIATGRARCTFPAKVNQMIDELVVDVFVTANGQNVEFQGQTLARYAIAKDKLYKLVEFFDLHGIDYAQVANTEIKISNPSKILTESFNPISKNYQIDPRYFEQNDVLQILPFYDESRDELIAQANILDGLKAVRWHPNSVDIFDKEGSKARGIQIIAEHLGLDMGNVMAFGDGLNDIEMLSAVGIGVAMGNGHELLKQQADYITDHIEENGIYNFLHKAGLV
ncbi:Cof-like hydrolase [Canicola haemoglobinophilus]|uniref:Cof-like hydrolase n=1 Tax=Canicola haemoglobinophilus TaxID=733 RepID=A0AB38H925_9PAST|nr:Cof-type HAD-IIB family hydrolase [Canicola haemoglobinophilus]STO55423.1 Cof-like hydrolase [Canicola haemoglobinophilus]STO67751.1 Cof-like hydrolase [Canicola haemoglobinophilus]